MTWLAIDATSDRLSVAAGLPGATIVSREVRGARQHAARLPALASQVLADVGRSIEDLEGLVVADGPGSFTGLRVSVAFAKAMSRARGLPLYSASTLLVRAWRARTSRPIVAAGVASALRGEVYVGVYRLTDTGGAAGAEPIVAPTVVGGERSIDPEAPVDAVVGEVADDVIVRFPWAASARRIGPPDGWPDASALIALIGAPGGAAEVASDWEPTYGRPAEAQARWEREHGRPLGDPTSTR